MLRWIVMAACLVALSGCASPSMSEAECLVADWRAVGFEDGARGAGPGAFGAHRTACAEHGVAPAFEDYLAGHGRGLEVYCKPQHAAHLGSRGHRYTGVCPAHLEGAFVAAHARGLGLYQRLSRLDAIETRLHGSRQRVKRIEQLFAERTAELLARDVAASRRAALVLEIKQLGDERGHLEHSIRDLEWERVDASEDYERYRAEIAQRD